MNHIRSILLHLDATASSIQRLGCARRLAHRHSALLSVMYAVASSSDSSRLALSERPGGMLETQERADLEQARAWFDDAMAQGGADMRWLRTDGRATVDGFIRHAMYADLLVLGQVDPQAIESQATPAAFLESVLIGSGRPGLILPHDGVLDVAAREPLIGWNATPAAARAVAAALPWLRQAKRVHVLDEAGDEARDDGALGIAGLLRLHGIDPVIHYHLDSAVTIGNSLLGLAADVHADLLVMGCYGHARVSELVFGGASRTVLQHMTLPVLMAT